MPHVSGRGPGPFFGALGALGLSGGLSLVATGMVTMWRTDLGLSKLQGFVTFLAGVALFVCLGIAAAATSAGRRPPSGTDPVVAAMTLQMERPHPPAPSRPGPATPPGSRKAPGPAS